MSENPQPRPAADRTLTVHGDQPLDLPWDPDDLERFELTSRETGFECASGAWIAAEWTGIPVPDLLEAAGPPPETTHVVFESVDGYRTCVGVGDLLDGLVAYDADDDARSGFPRLVSPSVVGPRASKRIVEMSPVALPPDADPEEREDLQLGGD